MTSPNQFQGAVLDTVPVGIVDDTKEAAATAAAAIEQVKTWISDRHNWVRVGWFVAGYTMIVVGVAILAKPAVDKAASSVGKITKGVI